MKEIAKRIRGYKELKADIVFLKMRFEELEEEILGVGAIPSEERTSNTYKITSVTENQMLRLDEEKEKLLNKIKYKERELAKIDNAMSVLTDIEKDIITLVLIEKRNMMSVADKYYRSYSWVHNIEIKALNKMRKYLQ